MAGTPVKNATSAQPALDEAAVEEFESRLRGEIIRPGDRDYDDFRRVDNPMIDWHPRLIARCADEEDVILAIDFAREHDLTVAVHGGSHDPTGFAILDGGLGIDLSPMTGSGLTRRGGPSAPRAAG